jgi:transcriptional regulator with GAF, ATPase, and Fis domain
MVFGSAGHTIKGKSMNRPGQDKTTIEQDRMAEFQRYISDLSTLFIALPASKVSAEIDKRLKEIGRFWDFGLIHLNQLTHEESKLTCIHYYAAPGTVSPPDDVETARVPWLMDVLRSGRPKALYNVLEELPQSATTDREVVKKDGTKSSLILPFIVGGAVQGGLFFNNVREYRHYPEELIRELQHLGQIFAGALERLKAFEQIQNTMRFDRLLSEISATYINLPSTDTIKNIRKDLGRLGRFLDVDRCIFYLAGEKKGTYRIDAPFIWWMNGDEELIREVEKQIKANPIFHEQYEYCFEKWNRGEVVQFSRVDELPPEAEGLRRVHEVYGTRSWLSLPVSVGGSIVGALAIATVHKYRTWSEQLAPRLRLFGEIFANAIKRKEHEESLKQTLKENRRLRRQVEADYVYLRDELTLEHNYEDIIGQSNAIKSVLLSVEQVAPTDVSVLILGETGTGKELIARAIHHASRRSARPLVKVNCAALAPSLIESELFGHEKGAFTGADKRRVGRFELADGASLFLDEIGELPMELQPKLLRVLQEGELERLGGQQTIRVDVRIITATNRDLAKLVEEGKFRSDLWYRLNSFPISVPPLRERVEDIPLLVKKIVDKYSSQVGKSFDKISKKVMSQLDRYHWPGNIRELDNIISRAVIISQEGNLQVQLPESDQNVKVEKTTLEEMERGFIVETLNDCGWQIEGRKGASQRLGLKASTLRSKMKKLKIRRPSQ